MHRVHRVLQKWSKGKMKEKVNNQVLFDQVGTLWFMGTKMLVNWLEPPQCPC